MGLGSRGADASGSRAPSAPARESVPAAERKKLSFNEQRELASLPAHIEALEAEHQRLQHEAASPEFYKETADHIRGVLARIDAIGPEMETALARWMELEERA